MKTQAITFTGHDGSQLAARLDLPEGEITATALFAHCFTCSKDIPAARRIAQRLAQRGMAVLRFDFTGLGHSEGEFANTNFTTNVADLILAAQALEERFAAPQLLVGHSLGGAAVLKAAGKIPSARAVATIGAPFDPAHVAHNFGAKVKEIEEAGGAQVDLAGRPFTICKHFLDDIAAQEMKPAIADLNKALLVLHAPLDDVVGIENAGDIFTAAKHPKSFVTLDDADHLVTRQADAEYAADTILAWVARYVDLAAEPVTKAAPDGAVHVSEADAKGFLQDVNIAGRHAYLADEPRAVGGADLGPTPYQYLSAGLGACTTMTIRMYARHKGYPLDHVAVDVYHDKRHIEAMEGDGAKAAKEDVFRRDIHVTGDLTEQQRADILKIADKCPVHKTLHGTAVVETNLLD
ncbi:bifunctional alpha/beta hydrolase/OsmC family protein [Thalassobius sp. Cn5-15]|uniref:bifunctional alpha/beta hydrolase/OsmC family protein n=1 Tax=Thalassobius sp. Cn5-15 TaxID=2917763 RepID=UPI001EF32798|nr:bifunctional alpha/beta hydrolase/OsmC family protein [Thalassobius sp. Cn5-15]MCG7492989.1 bifunctional alpha/beta hydrolase/OsmC family protein [Thalassobius sp. Cn5-15]